MSEPTVCYGFLTNDNDGIMLSMSDALYGDRLDKQYGHPRPMLDFDPFDHVRVSVQDAIFAESGDLPDLDAGWKADLKHGVTQPRWVGRDAEFEAYMKAIRDCCKLPLEPGFHNALVDLWEDRIQPEAARRIGLIEQRARRKQDWVDRWEDADLVGEVEAICGPGKREGHNYAFHCPWHPDKTPSLKVDPEKRAWQCWSCRRHGGVLDWRKREK